MGSGHYPRGANSLLGMKRAAKNPKEAALAELGDDELGFRCHVLSQSADHLTAGGWYLGTALP